MSLRVSGTLNRAVKNVRLAIFVFRQTHILTALINVPVTCSDVNGYTSLQALLSAFRITIICLYTYLWRRVAKFAARQGFAKKM